jgi:hypothetical protein
MVTEAEDGEEGSITIILQFYPQLPVERVVEICHSAILQMLPLLLHKFDKHLQRVTLQYHVNHLALN